MFWIRACSVTPAELTFTWSFVRSVRFVSRITYDSRLPVFFFFQEASLFSRLYRMNEDVYAAPDVWKVYTVSYMHYSTIGTAVGVAVGLAVSLLSPVRQEVDPRLLAPFVRRLVYSGGAPKAAATNGGAARPTAGERYAPVAQLDTRL